MYHYRVSFVLPCIVTIFVIIILLYYYQSIIIKIIILKIVMVINVIWVFPKIGHPPIIHAYRLFHYKPSILGYPYCWKHPYLETSKSI